MTAGYFDAATAAGHTVRINWSENSPNIGANTSNVHWWLEIYSNPSRHPFGSDGNWNVNINGATASGTFSYNFGSYTYLLLAQGDVTVGHDAVGNATIYVGGYASIGSAGGSATAAGYAGLDNIPRATTPGISPTSGNTDATYTISWSGASGTFAHDIYYSLNGGASYTNLAMDQAYAGTFNWTPASSLLPNSTSVSAVILLRTKNGAGGSIVGDKTLTLPLTVPATVVPTVSSVSWADAQTSGPDIPTMMGSGNFVQGWSKLIPTVTSAGAGGSTVTGTSVTVAGQQTSSGTAFTNPVTLSGAVPFTATATDSRSRTSSPYSQTVAVKAYNYPNLPTPLVQRTSDAAGTIPAPTGTYLAITPSASVSDLTFGGVQKNLLEWRVRIAPKATGIYVTVQDWTSATVSGTTWTTKYVAGGPYASSAEWLVEVSIRDVFGKAGYSTGSTVIAATVFVPTEAVLWDWDGGSGFGFGKYHQQGIIDAKGDVYVDGKVIMSSGNKGTQNGGKTLLDSDDLTTLNAADVKYGTVTGVTSAGVQVLLSDGVTTVVCSVIYQPKYTPRAGETVSVQLIAGTNWALLGQRIAATYVSAKPTYGTNYDSYETPASEWNSDVLGPWMPPEVTRTIHGVVMVTGMVRRTTGNFTINDIIVTLPVGFRPEYTCFFLCNTSAGYTRIQVDTDGTVRVASTNVSSSGGWIGLGRIMFPLGLTWTNLSLASGNSAVTTVTTGVTNVGTTVVGPYPSAPGYAMDANGIVWFRGGVKYSSAPADGTIFATMPTGYGPGGGTTRARQHHQICVSLGSSSIFGEVGVGSSTVNRDRVYKAGSGTSANAVGISLDGVPYASETALPTGALVLGIDGMSSYSGSTQWVPELYVYPDGFCYASGLNGGVSGVLGTLTDIARSRGKFMISTDCNNAPATVNPRANGTYSVFSTAASPAWLSVDTAWMADPTKVGDLNSRG